MKYLSSVVAAFMESRSSRRNLAGLSWLLLILLVLIAIYAAFFQVLMAKEGRGNDYSWFTGVYWTLTTMSTLGFGEITFNSDPGRLFSVVVLVSGVVFLLILLPFTLIEFFYAPFIQAQQAARAPRSLSSDVSGHVILIGDDPVNRALISKLQQYGYHYAMLTETVQEALNLSDEGIHAVVGKWNDLETYHRIRAPHAALVVSTGSDVANANVGFMIRELAESVPIVTTATNESAQEVLELAGVTHVLLLAEMMGQSLARRVLGSDAMAHVVGAVDSLLIAEAAATGTPFVGKSIRECNLRQQTGVNVIGVWERGRFELVAPETQIHRNTVLVLACDQAQLDAYNELLCIYSVSDAPIVVLGGGQVGQAVGRALTKRQLNYRIVEMDADQAGSEHHALIMGDAKRIEILEKAGIREASSVIITTRDDETNVYFALLCRKLRKNIQIISRATSEGNVATLHRAGADLVMSSASMGANAIFNTLRGGKLLTMAEGLDVFQVHTPEALVGKSIGESAIRMRTGCSVVAVDEGGKRIINPPPDHPIPKGGEIILIGSVEAEEKFLQTFK